MKNERISLVPRADRLVDALRQTGYDNYWAICDLIDNSIDAGADTIHITAKQEARQPIVRILDNGSGMNKSDVGEALRLGADTGKTANSSLGMYGMGLKTASWSIARNLTIVTKTSRMHRPLKAIMDIDEMKSHEDFIVFLQDADLKDMDRFGGQSNGTEVTLYKCDHLANKNTTEFSKLLMTRIGRVFRYKIDAGLKMYLNGTLVKSYDPLFITEKDKVLHQLYDHTVDGMIPISFTDSYGNKVKTEIGFRAVMLDTNEVPTLSIKNQGISYIRNGREIVQDVVWGESPYVSRHNKWNTFRAEIHLTGDLDPYFGVPFTKRNVEMESHLKKAIDRKIKRALMTAAKLRDETYGDKKLTPAKLRNIQQHVENILSKMADKQLIDGLPTTQKEARRKAQKKNAGKTTTTATQSTPKTVSNTPGIRSTGGKTQKALADYVRFENVGKGATGVLWDVFSKGGHVIIELNTDHKFYREVLARAGNASSQATQAIYSFIYFLGIAEMQMCEDDDDRMYLFDDIKRRVSDNTSKFIGQVDN